MNTRGPQKKISRRTLLKGAAVVAGGSFVSSLKAYAHSGQPRPSAPAFLQGAKAELHFWHMDYEPHVKSFGSMIKEFEKEFKDITIAQEPQPPQEWIGKFQQGFVSGSEGDLLAIHGQAAPIFVQSGVLEPLNGTAFPAGELEKRFYPSLLEAYGFKNNIYGLPLANNTPGIGFIINVKHFEEAKLEISEQFSSWDAVWETAKKLTKTDGSGKITRAGLNSREVHQLQYVCGMMLEQGKEYFDPASGTFSFNNAEGIKAIEVLTSAVQKHKVDSGDIPPAFDSLSDGRSSMGMIWIDYIPYAKSQFPNTEYGFIVRPPLAGNKLIVASEGPWGVNVSARSKNKAAALEFVKFMARDENLRKWYQEQNALPSAPALTKDPYFQTKDARWVKKALETMPDWKFEGSFPISKLNFDIAWPILEKAILGSLSSEEAAKQIEEGGNAMLKEFKAQVEELTK